MTIDSDDVGYMKPPKHSQFKKGQSGNPKGRPKFKPTVETNFEDYLTQHLFEPITVTINGRKRRVPRLQALAISKINQAMSGDPHATKLLWPLLFKIEPDDGRTIKYRITSAIEKDIAAFLEDAETYEKKLRILPMTLLRLRRISLTLSVAELLQLATNAGYRPAHQIED